MHATHVVKVLAVIILFCSLAYSQTVSGIISGSVVDSSNSAVAGATVRLTDSTTGDRRKMQTDSNGEFVFSPVLPGRYSVAVEKPVFVTILRLGLLWTRGDCRAREEGSHSSVTCQAVTSLPMPQPAPPASPSPPV